MRLVIVLTLSFLAISSFINADCVNKGPTTLKTYTIDLDLSPKERFKQTAHDFKHGIVELVNFQKKQMDLILIPILELIASDVDKYLPAPYNDELRGISEATGLILGDIVAANLIYDATAFCTSIVAQKSNGQILHGRNLDYNYQQFMTNITYMARFVKNGSLVFSSVQTAGFVGILSGHKKNAFTFTIDERDQGAWYINFLFAILDKKATPLAFLSRNVLEKAADFNSAISMLSTLDLIAPAYFIVGGARPYEGAVVTRAQDKLIDVWRLNATSMGIEKWYLLETNYDHWLPPPPNDDRRDPGMKAMNATGQANINYNTLMNVLTINPVCNKGTIYSVVMSANDDDTSIQVIIRFH